MQTYDIIMLAVLGISIYFGARKGMAWQIASISSLVVSYFAALKFSDRVTPLIHLEPPLNRIGAMLAVYLGSSLLIWLAFRTVSNVIERVKLKEFDHQIGGLFGAAKGVLYCVVITFFGVFLSHASRAAILKSQSGHYIAVLIDKVDPLLPPEVQKRIGPYLDKLDRQLDPDNADADAATVWDGSGDDEEQSDDRYARRNRFSDDSPDDGEEGSFDTDDFVNSTIDSVSKKIQDAAEDELRDRIDDTAERAGFSTRPTRSGVRDR